MTDSTMLERANPGSREAIDAGCTCAVLDNGHGRGYMGQAGIFVITAGCPLHGLGPGVDGGFLSTLTPEQRTEALKGFDGDDTLGDPESLKGEGE